MAAIYKRELKSFFHTMTGPLVLTVFLAFMGIFFVAYNIAQGYPNFSVALSAISIVLLLIVPILTMRSFAEEKKTKTDQLLLTSPVSVSGIVLGKYFSMVSVFGIAMLISCAAPLVIHAYGGNGTFADYLAILLFFLLGSAYIAIGMFISSLTENQIIAAVGTFAILLVLQLIDGISSFIPSANLASYVMFFVMIVLIALLIYFMTRNLFISGVFGVVCLIALTILFVVKGSIFGGAFASLLNSLSLVKRFDDITSQVFSLSTLVYYLSVAALFVFLTVQSIQKRRWS